jgi:hypothetical protein
LSLSASLAGHQAAGRRSDGGAGSASQSRASYLFRHRRPTTSRLRCAGRRCLAAPFRPPIRPVPGPTEGGVPDGTATMSGRSRGIAGPQRSPRPAPAPDTPIITVTEPPEEDDPGTPGEISPPMVPEGRQDPRHALATTAAFGKVGANWIAQDASWRVGRQGVDEGLNTCQIARILGELTGWRHSAINCGGRSSTAA